MINSAETGGKRGPWGETLRGPMRPGCQSEPLLSLEKDAFGHALGSGKGKCS